MIYRRSPPRPVQILLRVVAPATTIASLWACSSTPPTSALALDASPSGMGDDGGTPTALGVVGTCLGFCGTPSSSGFGIMGASASSGVAGSVPGYGSSSSGVFDDSGSSADGPAESSVVDGAGSAEGSVYVPPDDGGNEATGPCGGGVCGVIVHPDGG